MVHYLLMCTVLVYLMGLGTDNLSFGQDDCSLRLASRKTY